LHHFQEVINYIPTFKEDTWPCLQCFDAVGLVAGRASSL